MRGFVIAVVMAFGFGGLGVLGALAGSGAMPGVSAAVAQTSSAASAATSAPAAPAAAHPRIAVVTSFSLLADFVRQVGGDRVEVRSIVPAGGDVHVFQPGPQAARALAGARLVVVNGLGFEGWLDRLVAASGFRGPVAVASAGIEPLPASDGHAHGRDHGHGHDAAPAARAKRSDAPAAAPDPHAWQDVALARRYVANIRQALCGLDAAACPDFQAAAARYDQTLAALDDEIRRTLAPIPAERRRVLTSHDAFAYYGKAYGIAFLAPVGVSTEAEPSAAAVARLIREIRRRKVTAFFIENVSDPRLVERIGAETDGKRSGRLYADGLAGPDGVAVDYVAMMRANTRALAAALAP